MAITNEQKRRLTCVSIPNKDKVVFTEHSRRWFEKVSIPNKDKVD